MTDIRYYFGGILFLLLFVVSCTTSKTVIDSSIKTAVESINEFRFGGSSGMAQIDDHSYLVVYDLKGFQKGGRIGLVRITDESLVVLPVKVDMWDKDGISSDLESVCKVSGKSDEYLMSESGNWQGKLGRIFHVKVDTANLEAVILGSTIIPMLNRNDRGMVGDQYEGIMCLPYDDHKRVVVLGERGGSEHNPSGMVRWGILDLLDHSFTFSDEGIKGIPVDVPGDWDDANSKRDITDFYIDPDGEIWAGASEDQGDFGPFYSVIYKLGKINLQNKEKPFEIYDSIETSKGVSGFKIEALSGPCSGIKSTHSFGTEDENYGGVWRPINVGDMNKK